MLISHGASTSTNRCFVCVAEIHSKGATEAQLEKQKSLLKELEHEAANNKLSLKNALDKVFMLLFLYFSFVF